MSFFFFKDGSSCLVSLLPQIPHPSVFMPSSPKTNRRLSSNVNWSEKSIMVPSTPAWSDCINDDDTYLIRDSMCNPAPQCCQKNELGFPQCAHPFFLVCFSHCLPSRLLKQAHRCPISRSSLSSSIAHHFFAFIRLTISQEWWRHYAIGCNTITSLSHVSVAAKAGAVLSMQRTRAHSTVPSDERGEGDALWLPSSVRQPKVTLGLLGHH